MLNLTDLLLLNNMQGNIEIPEDTLFSFGNTAN